MHLRPGRENTGGRVQVEKLVVNGVKMIANMRGAWRLYDGEPDDVLTKSSMWGVIDNFRICIHLV